MRRKEGGERLSAARNGLEEDKKEKRMERKKRRKMKEVTMEKEKWVRSKGKRRREGGRKRMPMMGEKEIRGRREEMKIRIFLSFYKILLTEINDWIILEHIDN